MSENVIEEFNIKLGVSAKDWEDSMKKSGQLLVESGHILEEYIKDTIKCVNENGPYIVLAPGIALSHSRPCPSVLKTGLSLITLSEPVCFNCDNDPVDIVLTLAAEDDNSHNDKLQVIAEFFSYDENFEKLRKAKEAKEVVDMLNSVEI